jgi:branched-chain amino acid transport system substrate-binding protein
MSNIDRRTLIKGSFAAFAAATVSRAAFADASEPIMLGVSGPLTGPNAQYGTQWKQGFDLALDEIHAAGDINGRKLAYTFEDSQSDPRQSVAIAQKFVSDPKIVMELGDFSSPASMAASPIYQRAGLVQFGFTNSHPDFTKGGDFMWSTSVSQADEQPLLALYAVRHLGLKKLAVLHQNTDWGRTSRDYFVNAAKGYGAEVVVTEGYIADDRDFRSTLVRVRDANPDGLILISYYSDGALIARQARQVGLTQTICAASSAEMRSKACTSVHGIFRRTRVRRSRSSSRASRPNITVWSPIPSTPIPMTR